MLTLPVLIGPDVVRNDTWVPVLNSVLQIGFRLKRIRERSLCLSTRNVLMTPIRSQPDLLLTGDVSDVLGEGQYVCLLLETTKDFVSARTALDLIETTTTPGSVRARYGADTPREKRTFLFYPISQKHADLMFKAVF